MNPQLKQPKIRPGLPEPRAPADRPFNAIRSYLQDRATLAETVDRLADPIDSYYEREFDDLVEQSLYFTWETFNSIMVQIPYVNSAWHTKLAGILIGLSERPSPSREVRTVGEALNNFLWADLPYYSPEPLGGWGDVAGKAHAELEHDGRLDPDFAPALATGQCKALDYEVYAIHTMRAAMGKELHAAGLWMIVPGTVVWILYAGDFILDSQREWGPVLGGETLGHQGQSAAHGGTLWLRKTAFCRERWQFWRERFGAVVEREDVDEHTRSWAERATRKMEEIQIAPR